MSRLARTVCLALSLGATPALAGEDPRDVEAARELAVEGRTAFAKGDYERARDLFRRAHALVGAPTVSVYEARALVRLGRLVEAAAAYRRTVSAKVDPAAPEQFRKAVVDAAQELTELEPRIPVLDVDLRGASTDDPRLRLILDGSKVDPAELGKEIRLDPGLHRVELHLDGHPPQVASFTLSEREHRRVELVAPGTSKAEGTPRRRERDTGSADPAPSQREGSGRTLAYVSFGLGAAGLATGIATGIWAGKKHTEAERECPGDRCIAGSEGSRAVDDFRALRLVSTVGYGVGIAGAIGGVVLLVLSPPQEVRAASRGLEPWLGPDRGGVRGTF